MTALDKYVRLEALGLWRDGSSAEPREVVVSFGNASLILTDLSDRPLGHWALAGLQPVGRADGATVYSLTLEGEETLTIRDPEMIAAIAAVSRVWPSGPPSPPAPRRRFPFGALLLLALLAAVVAYGPGLLRDQAARMVPPEQAQEFGDRMLLDLIAIHGPACTDPAGLRALGHLSRRITGGVPLQVLGLGPDSAILALPGPVAVINRDAIAGATGPESLAALLGQALGVDPAHAALRRTMAAAGPLASLRYILTGTLSEAALARAADRALMHPLGDTPGPVFDRPVLSDRDWSALQRICG